MRWKERKERYETQQIADDQHDQEAATQGVFDQQIADIEQTAEQHNEVEKEYNMSVESTTNSVPSVLIPIEEKEPFSYAPSVISHMEQQCIIKQATKDRDQALMEAKYYRNLAETFKTEKRDIEQAYAKRVRDFWRNKIVEGDSRGG